MRKQRRIVVIISFFTVLILGGVSSAFAQYSKPVMRVYAAPYDTVWKALKETVIANKYVINVDKKREGDLETNVLILVNSDSVLDVMNQYGDVPFIPSAQWQWGQSQLTCRVKLVDTVVNLSITAQLRVYDNYTTNKWQYFASNGKIENALFDEVEKRMGR